MAENPFADPLRFERRAPPCAIVIFGANGDLTKRMLMPSLYRLASDGRVPPAFAVIGNSRTEMSDDELRAKMREAVEHFSGDGGFDPALWDNFASKIFYVAGDLKDPGMYQKLGEKLKSVNESNHTGEDVLFYLSTQPSYYAVVVENLGKAGLQKGDGWRRIVIEKPFGHDLASARTLNADLQKVFPERDIYRIDHYLGKETVQNIMAFRFGNGIFEPLWNRRYINHVQITAAESIGVEGRGAYYQEAGALRDMIQNHLLQVMATVTMEPPSSYDADNVRDERAKLLRSVRVMKHEDVPLYAVSGQYGPARVGGAEFPGFRQEQGVSPDSQTNTYAAVTFFAENWRWAGVPFYIRTGKYLPKRASEIAIHFKSAPLAVFRDQLGGTEGAAPNLLILRIQPEEGISL